MGIHEFEGSKANNIAIPVCRCVSVYYDPDDEQAPFKTLVHRGPTKTGDPMYGFYLATSPDGYHWTQHQLVVPYPPDGPAGTAGLAGSDVYYLWPGKVDGKCVVTYKVDRLVPGARHCVAISEGVDFKSFSDSKVILQSDLIDPPHI